MKFGEFFRATPKEELSPESSGPILKPEEKQQLAVLEGVVRMRMKNAILFSSFGDARMEAARERKTPKS